jgi:hypothetical protein
METPSARVERDDGGEGKPSALRAEPGTITIPPEIVEPDPEGDARPVCLLGLLPAVRAAGRSGFRQASHAMPASAPQRAFGARPQRLRQKLKAAMASMSPPNYRSNRSRALFPGKGRQRASGAVPATPETRPNSVAS